MKNFYVVFAFLFIQSVAFCQIDFQQGYYINNDQQRVSGLIKNEDWNNNPTEFDFKKTENAEKQTQLINDVTEFGVDDVSKYLRETVSIDRSSDKLANLTRNRNPKFLKEELFLKVLVEGKANLFVYNDGNLRRFFYQKDGGEIQQLIFKSYKTKSNFVAENNRYKQQIANELSCEQIDDSALENLSYKTKSLLRVFEKYNECVQAEYKVYKNSTENQPFHLKIKPGLRISSLELENDRLSYGKLDFGTQTGFSLGLELEYVLPFRNGQWSVFIEPTYQYFNNDFSTDTKNSNGFPITLKAKADYKSIEMPVGLRYYFFLNEQSKLFANAAYVFDFSFGSEISGEDNRNLDLEIVSHNSFAIGAGYMYQNKYSVEMRYGFSRQLFDNIFLGSEYRSLSLVFGYTLF